MTGLSTLTTAPAAARPHRTSRVTIRELEEALTGTHGLVTPAAAALGVSRQDVYGRIQHSARLQALVASLREHVTDIAEGRLYEALERGDPWAIAFYLKTQGKSRGYGDQVEVLVRQQADRLAAALGVPAEDLLTRAQAIANGHG